MESNLPTSQLNVNKTSSHGSGKSAEDTQSLVIVHIPVQNEKSRTIDSSHIKIISKNKGQFLPLGSNMKSFSSSEGKKEVSNFTINSGTVSSYNKKGSSFTYVSSQLVPPVLAKPMLGTTVTLPSSSVKNIVKTTSQSLKNSIKVSVANIKSFPISSTMIKSPTITTAAAAAQESTNTSFRCANSNVTFKNTGSIRTTITPGILRSPSKLRSPHLQVSTPKTSKPIVLHSNFVSPGATSSGGGKIISIPNSKTVNRFNPLALNVAERDRQKKVLPLAPSLILKGRTATNSSTIKSNPTTISLLTAKAATSTNAISVVPVSRRNSIGKPSMVYKISNGQIKPDPSNFKSEGLTLSSAGGPTDDQKGFKLKLDLSQGTCFQKLPPHVPTIASTTKDILQEAMSAMASDIFEEDNSHFPPEKDDGSLLPLPPDSVLSNVGTDSVSSSLSGNKVVQLTMAPSTTPSVTPSQTCQSRSSVVPKVSEDVGLVIGRDSVNVKKKVVVADVGKPDLAVIPQLTTTSDKAVEEDARVSSPVLNLLCTESFVDHVVSGHSLKVENKEASDLSCVEPPRSNDEDEKSDVKLSNYITPPLDISSEDDATPTFGELLNWTNGTGLLNGTDLKFKINEFDAVELVEDDKFSVVKEQLTGDVKVEVDITPKLELGATSSPAAKIHHVHRSRKTTHKEIKKEEDSLESDSEHSIKSLMRDSNDICCCMNCGCYGLSHEFLKDKKDASFCTSACLEESESKEAEWMKEKLRGEKNRGKVRKVKPTERDAADVKPNESVIDVTLSLEDTTKDVTLEGDGKRKFSWMKYLEICIKGKESSSKAAPLKLWHEPFPFNKNLFKVGMKLEAIDPQHQALMCVMTVVDTNGYRIRLHFDGFSDVHDFWCNVNSPNLFQAGTCEKHRRHLETPPGLVNFTWKAYVDHCHGSLAPKQTFSSRISSGGGGSGGPMLPSHYRVGMKLEADDRKNGWTCVATVADVMDHRILVHFDGWDTAFDAWFEVNSPFLHPVGWCSENGVYLFPPKDDPDPESFNWTAYIQDTNSVVVPARTFKPRPPKEFKVGMKLEAVDKRNAALVRVATVVETKDYKVRLNFDGWPDAYNVWVDDDSPDIHPPTWCQRTGHALQPPLTPEQCAEYVDAGVGCGTPGCKGYGHVKGLIYNTHHTAYGCPYSMQNLGRDWESVTPDRLDEMSDHSDRRKKSKSRKSVINLDPSKPIPVDLDDDSQPKRVRKRRKFFDEIPAPAVVRGGGGGGKVPRTACSSSEEARYPSSSVPPPPGPVVVVGSTHKPTVVVVSSSSLPAANVPSSSSPPPPPPPPPPQEEPQPMADETTKLDSIIHQSVFNPFSHPNPPIPRPALLDMHKRIASMKQRVTKGDVTEWTSKDVKQFVSCVSGCNSAAKIFVDHKIDGKTLLMVTQDDIVGVLGIKLGPAIKIIASIITLKNS